MPLVEVEKPASRFEIPRRGNASVRCTSSPRISRLLVMKCYSKSGPSVTRSYALSFADGRLSARQK
jgi:hypothetical protein